MGRGAGRALAVCEALAVCRGWARDEAMALGLARLGACDCVVHSVEVELTVAVRVDIIDAD